MLSAMSCFWIIFVFVIVSANVPPKDHQ
jgi:hypothetical protein